MEDPRDMLAALARPVRHEANNLLAALSGTAELMLRSRDATERDLARAERLRDAAARLQALLHGYLALGAPPPDAPPGRLLELMRPLAALLLGPGRAVEVEVAEGVPALAPAALLAACLQLMGGAGTAAEAGLRLRLEPAPGGALLSAVPLGAAGVLDAMFLEAAP